MTNAMSNTRRSVGLAGSLLLTVALISTGTTGLSLAESSPATVHPAKPMPADETAGPRPYEMVRAGRKPPHVPLVNFDSLEGWQVECTGGGRCGPVRLAEAAGVGIARRTARLSRHLGQEHDHAASARADPDPRRRIGDDPLGLRQQLVVGARAGDAARHRSRCCSWTRTTRHTRSQLAQVGWKEWWLVHKVLPQGPAGQEAASLRGSAHRRRLQQGGPRAVLRGLGLLQRGSGPAELRAAAEARHRPVSRPVARREYRAGPAALPHAPGDDPARQSTATTFSTRLEQAGEAWRFTYKDADTQLRV